MSDENREEIEITAKDLTAAGIESAKKNLGGLGESSKKTSEAARLGFWGMGEAAENAAQSMGVPNQMSRQLGNSIEGMASKLGGAALAFGLVGFAAMAVAGVYSSLAEQKEKDYQATMALGKAAQGTITGLIDERSYTSGLRQEIEELNKKKREMATEDLQRAIDAQTRKINEMSLSLKDQGGLMSQFGAKWTQIKTLITDGKFVSAQDAIREATAGQNREIDSQIMLLQELYLAQKKNNEGKTKKDYEEQPAFTELQFREMQNAAIWEEQHQFDIDMLAWKAENIAISQGMDYEAFLEKNQLAAESTQFQIQQEERLASFKQQAFTSSLSFMTQSFQAMYNAGGSHARRNFSLFKTAAIAETIISADRAAGSAYAWGSAIAGPPLGVAMAAIAYAAGWARVQSIRKQTFDGGGGGGGGAPVTYGGSSAVVPASSAGGGAMNLTLNINGQQAGMYEITKGVLKTIWSNNGSVDGLSVSVEQSA